MRRLLIFFLFVHISSIQAQRVDSVQVSAIRFAGLKKTRHQILLREILLKEGQKVALNDLSTLLEQSRRNIVNTNLFLSVTVSDTVKMSEKSVSIDFVLRERWYLIAYPEIILSDRGGNSLSIFENGSNIRFTYGLGMRWSNFSGRDDFLRFRVLLGYLPVIEVSYGNPGLNNKRTLGAEVGVTYLKQRTIAYNTLNDQLKFLITSPQNRTRQSVFFKLNYRPKYFFSHHFFMSYTMGSISDTLRYLNPNYLFDHQTQQSELDLGYRFRYDKRDNRQYPLRGQDGGFSISKRIDFKSRYQEFGLGYYYSWYIPISKKWYVETSLVADYEWPRNQPYYVLGGFGFRNYLVRGYESYVVHGTASVLQRNTLRYQALSRSYNLSSILKISQFNLFPLAIYPNVFFDHGEAFLKNKNSIQSQLSNKPLFGYGVGIDFVTWYNTTVKVYSAFNREGGRSFNISIINNTY